MLIILYGKISNEHNWKQQRMIDGGSTCGYREYARNFGHIIYLSPQKVSLPWEHCITKPANVVRFIREHPDSIVWSVKHDPKKDIKILSRINNKKIYYSCNAANICNNFCDVSLVDTEKRLRKNAKLWFKGKDPDYWKPSEQEKEYDYLLMGIRADKNELYFLKELTKIKGKRKILWIGGKKHRSKIKTSHDVTCTKFMGQDQVRDMIPRARVGVLFTELKIEGFPQSFLEMTMCGVPVVYNKKAPRNKFYFHPDNSLVCHKANMVEAAEKLLVSGDSVKCRETAIKYYSIQRSYERILECLK